MPKLKAVVCIDCKEFGRSRIIGLKSPHEITVCKHTKLTNRDSGMFPEGRWSEGHESPEWCPKKARVNSIADESLADDGDDD